MNYTPPEKVVSPQNKWILKCVLYDGQEGRFAIAYGTWENEPSYGFRWNGAQNAPLGYPLARNQFATWFIMPENEVGEEIVKILSVQLFAGSKFVNEVNLKSLISKLHQEQRDGFYVESPADQLDIPVEDTQDDLIERVDGQLVVAMQTQNQNDLGPILLRWNGTTTHPLGFPTAGNNAKWFMVPDQIGKSLVTILCRFSISGNEQINKSRLRVPINLFFYRDDLEDFASDFDVRKF